MHQDHSLIDNVPVNSIPGSSIWLFGYPLTSGQSLYRSLNQGHGWERVGEDFDLQSQSSLTSTRNPYWIWADITLSIDIGENWRRKAMPYLYEEHSIGYFSNPVMGPDWSPNIFFASQVDGVWTHAEDYPPQIMMAGTRQVLTDNKSSLLFNAWITDVNGPENIETVDVLYEGIETGLQLVDDGTQGDCVPNDGLFSLKIPIEVEDPVINIPYSINARDTNGMSGKTWPELRSTTKWGGD